MTDIFKRFYAFFDRLFFGLFQMFGGGVFSFCDPQSVTRRGNLRCSSGALVSLVEIKGVYTYQTENQEHGTLDALCEGLRPALLSPGQAMQIMYYHDSAGGKQVSSDIMGDLRRSAHARGLRDMEFFLDDMADVFGEYVADEKVVLALWTDVKALTSHERQEMKKFSEKNPVPPAGAESAPFCRVDSSFEDKHDMFVDSILSSFSKAGISAEKLSPEDTLTVMRKCVDPSVTSRDWKPAFHQLLKKNGECSSEEYLAKGFFIQPLPGTTLPVYFPSLKKQIIPTDAEIVDRDFVVIGERYHAPLYLALAPQEVQRFNRFLKEIKKKKCSFRMTWDLLSKEEKSIGTQLQKALSNILYIFGDDNKKISNAYKGLEEQSSGGETLVGFRGVFDVWVDKKGTHEETLKELRSQVSLFVGVLQGWGSQEVRTSTGDPWQAFCAGIPGMTLKGPMQTCLGGIRDIVDMLPFFRAFSPWVDGGLRRTPDGKVYPMRQGSKEQNSWLTLGVAPPGGGKSLAMNLENLEFALLPGLTELPYIRILDFGFSSTGVINLLKHSLPPDQKGLAVYIKLRNTLDSAINPFDTPVCVMKPSVYHHGFLTDFLTLLCTPVGEAAPEDGVDAFVRHLVGKCYEYADGPLGRRYLPHTLPDIDKALGSIADFRYDNATTWRDVAKTLFLKGFRPEAEDAHRMSMPTIGDAVRLCNERNVIMGYDSTVKNSETVYQYVARKLKDALEHYPIFGATTRFTLGESRIVSLDLEDVARGGGATQARQAGVFYLLGYHLLAGGFFDTVEDVSRMPEFVREYHKERIEMMKSLPKKICIDEAHRIGTAGKDLAGIFNKMVSTQVRESRKHRILLTLMSQTASDYSKELIELCSSFYVFASGGAAAEKDISEMFGLGESGMELQKSIGKPGRSGSTLLAIYKTDRMIYTNLMITVGIKILWAFSTTREDVTLRDRLYAEVGLETTLDFLAREYPSGSVKGLLERMSSEMSRREETTVSAEKLLFEKCMARIREIRDRQQ